jgi:predicted RNase H-like nuclease (RuvC/YqgF family)
MFSPKVCKEDYERLEHDYEELNKSYHNVRFENENLQIRHKELEEKYQKDLSAAKRKIQALKKSGTELEKELETSKKQRKLEVYVIRFLNVICDLDEQKKIFKDAGGEYECVKAVDFRNQLTSMKVNVNETLGIFRALGWILTDKNAYTTTRRVDGKIQRVIAFKSATDSLLRELCKRV